MEKRSKTMLTTRLEGLSLKYPDCSWAKELLELNHVAKSDCIQEIRIDNDIVDTDYTVLISEN